MKVVLYYGYNRIGNATQWAHSLVDVESNVRDQDIRADFAKTFCCSVDELVFGSCVASIPDETENRILKRGARAAKGYAIMAMRIAGLDEQTIQMVSARMNAMFDGCTVEESAK